MTACIRNGFWYIVYHSPSIVRDKPIGVAAGAPRNTQLDEEDEMATVRAVVQPIDDNFALKDKTYQALQQAIAAMNIYGEAEEPRLDERRFSQ